MRLLYSLGDWPRVESIAWGQGWIVRLSWFQGSYAVSRRQQAAILGLQADKKGAISYDSIMYALLMPC